MATRVIKLREAEEPAAEMAQEVLSQSKRPLRKLKHPSRSKILRSFLDN